MKIEILEYIEDASNSRVAFVDFKVIYSPEKWEIFRNVSLNKKDGKTWLNIGKCKRGEKWLDKYERSPSIKEVLFNTLKELKEANQL